MAFSVPTNEVIPVTLESDDDKEPEYRTVFHVRPRTQAMQNRIAAEIGKASKFRDGKFQQDAEKVSAADVKTFLWTVERVENFFLIANAETADLQPFQLNGDTPTVQIHGRGFHKVNAESEAQLRVIARNMAPADLKSLSDLADDVSRLLEREKKR